MEVLQGHYINPFETDIDKDKLFCLSSALPVSEKLLEHLLILHEKGKSQYTEFVNKILHTKEKLFHKPIKRNPKLGVKSLNKKTVLKNKKVSKLTEIC